MAKSERITSRSGIVKLPFTQMPDHILEDNRINGNAYRVMNYIMSKPEDWVFYRQDIEKRLGFGKDAYYTARKQLYECGYLEYLANNKGTDFIYYERPDKNPFYMNGNNRNVDRKIAFSPLLKEIIEKENNISFDNNKKLKQTMEMNRQIGFDKFDINYLKEHSKNFKSYTDNTGDFSAPDDLYFEE
jgi:hypothetical protein